MTAAPTDELLAASGSSSSADPSDSDPTEPELSGQPTRLDRYLLLERIGRGSFASVWAAYDPQLDRRVAIKLLRQPANASSAQLAEAQALARLSHPNVVAVHDVQRYSYAVEPDSECSAAPARSDTLAPLGPKVRLAGSGHAGEPEGSGHAVEPHSSGHAVEPHGSGQGVFIVMEFLAGASLHEWMEQPHDWREVVAVFIEAGRGLAAAHERGLVHRDFKPSNVMFGADGRVRVLDFGLARSTADREQAGRKRRISGTPAYMAPEQHLGEAVDARSDQFAFCVALYEALYGRRPFVGRDRVVLGKAKLQSEIRPPPRNASVPAWLHAVVVRGLAADRDARWPDMNALLVALARDPSFVRRRLAVAIGLTLALAGAAFGLAWFADDAVPQACQAPERELVGVWDDAVRAQIKDRFAATQLSFAEQAYRRVERALDAHTQEWTDLHREVCEATLVRHEQSVEVMAEQMLCLQRRLRRIGGLVHTLAQADAASVARAGDVVLTLESPATCRERTTETREQALDPARRGGLLALEGEIARVGVLTQLGRYEEAVAVAQPAIEHALELADAGGAGRAWLAQTRALWYLGRFDDAIDASEQAMHMAAKVGDQETLAMAQIRLIRTYTSMGKFEVAEAVARLVAPLIQDGRLGRELESWYDLYVAILRYKQMRFDEAIDRLEHGLALRQQLYGPGHAELAAFHNTWGNVLFSQNDYDGALDHYHEAGRLWERNFGPEYPDLGSVNNNIGAIYLKRRQYDQARPYFERVLASYELSIAPDSPQVAMTLANLGAVDERKGRLRAALALHERARTILAAKIGEDNVNAALVDRGRAKVLYELGEVHRAELLITRVLGIQRRDAPDDLETIIVCAELLAAAQYERGDFVAWRTTVERLLDDVGEREIDGSNSFTLYFRAQLARQAADHELALELAEQYIAALAGELGADHEHTTVRLWLVISLLIDAGKFDEAATRARAALASTQMDPADRRRWQLEFQLGRAEAGRGDREAATAALQRALEFCSGPDGNPRRAALVREQLDAMRD